MRQPINGTHYTSDDNWGDPITNMGAFLEGLKKESGAYKNVQIRQPLNGTHYTSNDNHGDPITNMSAFLENLKREGSKR